MVGEIADLVESVPYWKLHDDLIVHLGDDHGHAKQVLLRLAHGDGIVDGGPRGQCRQNGDQQQGALAAGAPPNHSAHRLAPCPDSSTCPRRSSNFSHRPSKLPLDMATTMSPG